MQCFTIKVHHLLRPLTVDLIVDPFCGESDFYIIRSIGGLYKTTIISNLVSIHVNVTANVMKILGQSTEKIKKKGLWKRVGRKCKS